MWPGVRLVQVTITRLDENCRLSIGWATNRVEHDAHVGMQGVSLGFSATNGRILFCGGQPLGFLTGVRFPAATHAARRARAHN